ncbi:hypothetical protein GWI33_014585 [Rhynchophorus ferrugineus]|uniref:Tudor domain-containing protein n=1 Tax=Rhynchophorus ferrugineus TaxID=354439 RepID=A0A834I4R9_RHYFE|nr:hypothetical protein GWI33_014585 [Rhynchophorus ferrugineus]
MNNQLSVHSTANFPNDENEHRMIPDGFDDKSWVVNNVYSLRVSHIESPSNFWIVINHRELGPFHCRLNDFYHEHKDDYKADSKTNRFCVVYTSGSYCRALLINPDLAVKKQTCLLAFLVDFGSITQVDPADIYLLSEMACAVPQFAIKATLAGLEYFEPSTWSQTAVARFVKLVEQKLLSGQLKRVNQRNKILHLDLADYNGETDYVTLKNDLSVLKKFLNSITSLDVHKNCIKDIDYKASHFHGSSFSSVGTELSSDTMMVKNILKEIAFKCQNIMSGIKALIG